MSQHRWPDFNARRKDVVFLKLAARIKDAIKADNWNGWHETKPKTYLMKWTTMQGLNGFVIQIK
jgi:hypothetical protein